jgi:V/A-type H+/Na+-transporting ATPase subunit C
LLRDTQYGEAAELFAAESDLRRVEQFLFEKEIQLFAKVIRDLSGTAEEFTKALLARHEVETLKRALRTWYSIHVKGRGTLEDGRFIYRGYPKLRIDELLRTQDLEEIASLLSSTPFGSIIADAAAERGSSLFGLEIALDNYYYSHLDAATELLGAGDRALARRLLGVEIDLENLERIIRLKELYGIEEDKLPDYLIPSVRRNRAPVLTPGGTSTDIVRNYISSNYSEFAPLLSSMDSSRYSNLMLLESLLREVLAGEIRRALRGYPFTLGIVLAYFFLVRRETRRVMLVLNAKHYGLDEDRIRSLL